MTDYLLKRLAAILPTLVLVSMLIFGLQQLLPGDPAKILAGEEQDPNVVAYLTAKLHLDEPLPVRYGYWVAGVCCGGAKPIGMKSIPSSAAMRDLTPHYC